MHPQAQSVPMPPIKVSDVWQRAARWRRGLVGAVILIQTVAASYAMLAVLPYQGSTWLERAILAVYAILFAWISAGFWIALLGFLIRRRGGDRLRPSTRYADVLSKTTLAPTAIVYPIYHEEIERTFAGIRSTFRDIERSGHGDAFEFFVLSDSRDPEVWLREREACAALRTTLGGQARLHYRRRPINLNRKTGNLADFLRRWGRQFRYLVVMDADSVMQGTTLTKMVRLMETAPQIGILQSSPAIINARSAHARLQQFGNRLYGPLFTDGLAALQLGEAVFWGHNAIIRVDAFMRHCGLRRLRGRGFMTGSVLSHDFVEATYMRRAGYEVWLDPGLDGSYEEAPPTLVDELERDRRWAHGNLQHLYFMFRHGIAFAHRLAFANGIMAYFASMLWFTYLALITIELARFTLWPIDYFPEPHSPFPVWPQWQPEWAVRLMLSTLSLLFAPKILALIDIALDRLRAKAMGGMARITFSVLLESLTSILLAPIRMLSHTRYVVITLFNLKVRWAGQNRTQEISWSDALLHHLPGGLLALAWSAFAYWLKPMFFYWSLPVALPLLFAAPVSVWLSRFSIGRRWRYEGLLQTPEENDPPTVVTELAANSVILAPNGLSAFETAVLHPQKYRLHVALAHQRRSTPTREQRRHELIERCLAAGPQALTSAEKGWLIDDAQGFSELHRRVWQCPTDSPWARSIEVLCRNTEMENTVPTTEDIHNIQPAPEASVAAIHSSQAHRNVELVDVYSATQPE